MLINRFFLQTPSWRIVGGEIGDVKDDVSL